MSALSLMTLLLLASRLLPACDGGSRLESGGLPQDDVVVKSDPEHQETSVTISAGDCRISWTVYLSETNRGVVRHRSDCGLSLAGQAPLIGKLLRKVMESESDKEAFRTLSWGRLYPDGARDATLSVRLVLAAKRSVDWDPAQGRPRSGDINGWVRNLANQALIYDELRPVFRESGLEIRLASVEKVLVQKAKLLPFFERLREAGTRPEDRVPFDCQAWFSVRLANAPQQ